VSFVGVLFVFLLFFQRRLRFLFQTPESF
jgi:hypothetical protein